MVRQISVVFALSLAAVASAGSLTDIKHVVLFMQENRAFDHYFGTMAGIRGFSDPNVQVNSDGRTTFQQDVTPQISTAATTLLPWYINYEGGTWVEATQCMAGGSNGWQANHAAFNEGLNNLWAVNNTPYSWGHFQRSDIPVHFSIAEGWTVGDMYQEGVMASTNPNRVTWMSGSVNCPGGPQTPDEGGTVLDNNGTPGCEAPGLSCFPFSWKTVPEFHQDAGVTWQVYQDVDNFGDDPLVSFVQFQNAPDDSPLTQRGTSFPGLDKFYADAAAGTLPMVSWIVGPAELSEHPPFLPQDGAWLQKQVVEAVINGAAYNNTVLIISYDETGGWGDHVNPFRSPTGTAGEWLEDPFGIFGETFTGPGFRLPFYIISPWTRGGNVFTEHADHNSQIMFVEQWLEAIGIQGAQTDQMPAWRRAHMSNLLNAFDFENPDFSLPVIAPAITPSVDSTGAFDGSSLCLAQFPDPQPPVPFGPANENLNPSTLSEEGFKGVRGYLTEGRFLVFEMNGFALTNAGASATAFTGTAATAGHESITQRWVVHATGGTATDGGAGPGTFVISSALDGRFIAGQTSLTTSESGAETFTITDLGNGAGYTLVNEDGKFVAIEENGRIEITGKQSAFNVFSVTYQS